MGLAILYRALRLRGREEILSTVHDHFATDEALRLSGGRVRRVRLYDPKAPATASADEIASRLRAAIRPRTRAVAITWVHSSTGVKLPMDEVAAVVREAGERRGAKVLLCVDGVHALAAEDIRLPGPGIDFLAAGCHKWLMGPRGTGILWGTPAAWNAASRPLIPSFANASYGAWIEGRVPPADPPGPAMTPGGFQAYEHRWALPAAFAFQERIGKARGAARIHALAARMKAGLAEVRGVRLVTPREPDLAPASVCADIAGVDPGAAVQRLAADRISATVTPYAERHSVRLRPRGRRGRVDAGGRDRRADRPRVRFSLRGDGGTAMVMEIRSSFQRALPRGRFQVPSSPKPACQTQENAGSERMRAQSGAALAHGHRHRDPRGASRSRAAPESARLARRALATTASTRTSSTPSPCSPRRSSGTRFAMPACAAISASSSSLG